MIVICICGNQFKTFKCKLKDGRGKYCSKKCLYENRVRPKGLKYNFVVDNSGRFKKGDNLGENHHNWKGDNASYFSLHSWVYRKLGSPKKCEHCGTTEAKRFEWANKSGEYKRDISDWIRLCSTCHGVFDSGADRGRINRRFGYVA